MSFYKTAVISSTLIATSLVIATSALAGVDPILNGRGEVAGATFTSSSWSKMEPASAGSNMGGQFGQAAGTVSAVGNNAVGQGMQKANARGQQAKQDKQDKHNADMLANKANAAPSVGPGNSQ